MVMVMLDKVNTLSTFLSEKEPPFFLLEKPDYETEAQEQITFFCLFDFFLLFGPVCWSVHSCVFFWHFLRVASALFDLLGDVHKSHDP